MRRWSSRYEPEGNVTIHTEVMPGAAQPAEQSAAIPLPEVAGPVSCAVPEPVAAPAPSGAPEPTTLLGAPAPGAMPPAAGEAGAAALPDASAGSIPSAAPCERTAEGGAPHAAAVPGDASAASVPGAWAGAHMPAHAAVAPAHVAAPTWHNNPLLMALAAGAIAVFVGFTTSGITDNDIWFILATGREIVENGIPYVNPFSLHEGMGIIVQQWVPCVIAYGIYSLGGFGLLAIWSLALIALLLLSLYRLGRQVKGDRFGGEWILLAMLVALPALDIYLSMRPHAYTMIAFVWLLVFCERYRDTGRFRWLGACVALVAVHVNFHMAMAPYDLVVIACYLVPDLLAPFHRRGHLERLRLDRGSYRRLPVLACLVACGLALLLNPYGLDGALYLVKSYEAAGYGNFIRELLALTPWTIGLGGASAVAMLVLAAFAAGKEGIGRVNLPLLLLTALAAVLAFQHTRNVWLLALFAFPMALSATHGWSLDFRKWKPRLGRKGTMVVRALSGVAGGACAVVAVVLVAQAMPSLVDYENEATHAPAGLLDAIERDGADKETVRLFNTFNAGGYIEWRGFRTFMDPRPELWNSPITGQDEDYYNEYVDMLNSGEWTAQDFEDFLERYDFDYLIVEKNSTLDKFLNSHTDEYGNMMGTGNYVLWKHKA